MSAIETVGIVGFGPMGQLLAARMLPAGVEVAAFDTRLHAEVRRGQQIDMPNGVKLASLGSVANADVVIFAVPARSLEPAVFSVLDVSQRFKSDKKLAGGQIFVDISSVKEYPDGIFTRAGINEWDKGLLCHPLFGPQSVNGGIVDKDIIVTRGPDGNNYADQLFATWIDAGARISNLHAGEHDEQMAVVQALPFAVGRAFNQMGLSQEELTSLDQESLRYLQAIADVDVTHSDALTETILGFNHHATAQLKQLQAEVRKAATAQLNEAFLSLVVGHALSKLRIVETPFTTPSFENLKRLAHAGRSLEPPVSDHNGFVVMSRTMQRFSFSLRNVIVSTHKSARDLMHENEAMRPELA